MCNQVDVIEPVNPVVGLAKQFNVIKNDERDNLKEWKECIQEQANPQRHSVLLNLVELSLD